ncbi:hypothetical protein [Arthrobacter sp. 131MFCol6.1]|uniref:hypothetical protein n=1 Tax=Arthrobacter sp. 131MFCol6.1 TaxID=1157944 RepID=UPI000378E776|nr:hypothetical protein [Arthrobacter sp. 131MFCol6.1]
MLEHTPDGPPPLVAAPRHLRRRRMHAEIADTLLVPGAEPLPLKEPPAEAPAPAEPETANHDAADLDTASQDAADLDTASQDAANAATEARDKESQQLLRDAQYRRKRRVALLGVLFVAIALPAIVLALLLG